MSSKNGPAKHDAPKHEPFKHEPHKKDEPAKKDDAKKDEPVAPVKQTGTFAPVSHEQAVEEGVKASESHRVTTEDVAVAESKPVKAAPPHPLLAKLTKLKDELTEVAKEHKEKVLELRAKLTELTAEVPGDVTGHTADAFSGVVTQIEEGLNMLDPDCSAKAPG